MSAKVQIGTVYFTSAYVAYLRVLKDFLLVNEKYVCNFTGENFP